ncbi:hypothetical protein DNTS_003339, partial [Danionella cerebrum]
LLVFLVTLIIIRRCHAKLRVYQREALKLHQIYDSEVDEELRTFFIDQQIELRVDSDGELSDSDTEAESTGLEGCSADSSGESLTPRDSSEAFQKLLMFLSALRLLVSSVINSAGKVVVALLLGLAGLVCPSLTSALYFLLFLLLVWSWVLGWSISLLLFSSLCVMMSIFSAGHLLILYLYQLPVIQQMIPARDDNARLFGLTTLVQFNASEPFLLIMHPDSGWPEVLNPLLLLILYYTLIAMIHIWTRTIDEERTGLYSDDDCSTSSSFSNIHPFSPERNETVVLLWTRPWSKPAECGVKPLMPEEEFPDCFAVSPFTQKISYDAAVSEERRYEEKEMLNALEADQPGSSALKMLGDFIMKHSYITALIITMVWSISYNSWLTLVLLVWSCVIWMIKDRRRFTMCSAPFLSVYGTVLILLSFVSQLHLTHIHMLPALPKLLRMDLDLCAYPVPCLHLVAKVLFCVSFWILLRQHLKEKLEEPKLTQSAEEIPVEAQSDPGEQSEEDSSMFLALGSSVKTVLVKYWIFCCGFMFFFVSFSDNVAIYKIIYICLFLFCVLLYQVDYEAWRRSLKYFWAVVVGYSMLVLILIYIYQFRSISQLFQQILCISEERLRDLGLEQFDTVELFARILRPAFFLLACILQLHYFNSDFLSLTDLQRVPVQKPAQREEDLKETLKGVFHMMRSNIGRLIERLKEGRLDGAVKLWLLLVETLHHLTLRSVLFLWWVQDLGWRLLELHSFKLLSAGVVWVCVKEVSLMNLLFVVLWVFSQPYPRLRPLAFRLSSVWTCVMVICKMMYQLKSIKPSQYSSNCTADQSFLNTSGSLSADLLRSSALYVSPVDPALWLGALRKCEDRLLPCLWNHLLILALLVIHVTVQRHQLHHRLHRGLQSSSSSEVLFPGISLQSLEQGVLPALKYFVNFFFYRFGLEVCLVVAVNVIGQRMDLCSLLHSVALMLVLARRRRKAIAELWQKYCCFIAGFMTLQYLLCIGVPPALCKDYPWRTSSSQLSSNLIKWLFLPDYATAPNPSFILYDGLLLLVASLQLQVFQEENRASVRLLAGDNVEISRKLDPRTLSQYTNLSNFLHCRSYLDLLKVCVFSYIFWMVLSLIFLAGSSRISIFCLGYLLSCFYLMLFGGSLLTKPVECVLRRWDALIAYTCVVISLKNLLSLGSCAFLDSLQKNGCWLIQAFSMFCTIKGYSLPPADSECELPAAEAGIIWDAICFTVLLVQRRVFLSYYFLHVASDLQTSKILASRGAELFEAKLKKQVAARLELEIKSVEMLKKQMEKIRSKQRSGPHEQIPSDPGSSKNPESGYDLFETDSEEEEEETKDESQEDTASKKKTAFQLAYEAWVAGPGAALKEHEEQEHEELPRERRLHRQEGTTPNLCSEDLEGALLDSEGVDEEDSEERQEEFNPEEQGREPLFQRALLTLKFLWVFLLCLTEDSISALNSLCKDSLNISRVLRLEKTLLSKQHS